VKSCIFLRSPHFFGIFHFEFLSPVFDKANATLLPRIRTHLVLVKLLVFCKNHVEILSISSGLEREVDEVDLLLRFLVSKFMVHTQEGEVHHLSIRVALYNNWVPAECLLRTCEFGMPAFVFLRFMAAAAVGRV